LQVDPKVQMKNVAHVKFCRHMPTFGAAMGVRGWVTALVTVLIATLAYAWGSDSGSAAAEDADSYSVSSAPVAAHQGGSGPAALPAVSGSRVSAANGTLTLDGKPWWPTGFNAYELGTNWDVNKGCGAQVDLDQYFGSLPPHSVTRFDAFASLATDKRTGAQNFQALDAVFAAAKRHDQLLIAVLTSGDGACEDSAFKDHDWFAGGWQATASSYARWLDTAVARWGNSPALAGWEMVGEPETSFCGDTACQWQQRTCPSDAAATLRSFFDTAGSRLRALDSRTPIWAGFAGGGQCGTAGDDYALVAQSPSIDVLDVHDYGPPGVLLPGDQYNGVQRRLQQAKSVGKPLVIGEVGQPAGSCGSLTDRASFLTQKVQTQRQAGSAGVMFWAYVPDPRLTECTMDIGPQDPLFNTLRALQPATS
jgi:mannan endo-1,4-beta-mannosidase